MSQHGGPRSYTRRGLFEALGRRVRVAWKKAEKAEEGELDLSSATLSRRRFLFYSLAGLFLFPEWMRSVHSLQRKQDSNFDDSIGSRFGREKIHLSHSPAPSVENRRVGTSGNKGALSQQEEAEFPHREAGERYFERYLRTLMETQLLIIGEILSELTMRALGIQRGHREDPEDLVRLLTEERWKAILAMVVVGPFFEEASFRLFPSLVIGKKGKRWEVGVPISVIFALAHNLQKDKVSGGIKFNKEFIPLPQFLAGIYYWYLVRERGFSHAVLAHATNNGLAMAVMLATLLLKNYPPRDSQGKNGEA